MAGEMANWAGKIELFVPDSVELGLDLIGVIDPVDQLILLSLDLGGPVVECQAYLLLLVLDLEILLGWLCL